jgi:hypothetical protein
MSRDHAVDYLTLAFQTQRPTIHERSANFRKSYRAFSSCFFNPSLFLTP